MTEAMSIDAHDILRDDMPPPMGNPTNIDLAMPILNKTPRDYQSRGLAEVERYMIEDGLKRILYKGPTGTGKTLISKMVALSNPIRRHLGLRDGEKMRILFIANKHRLNRQALEEYRDVTGEGGAVELMVHSAFSEIPPHIVERGWDMCFIDEAHHEAMMSIQLLLARLIEKPIIGFTADDERGDGQLLKFERVVCPLTERDAALAGYIEKVGVNTVLDTGVRDKSVLAGHLVEQYHRHMGNTIAFFKTNDEASRFHRGLRDRGLTSMILPTTATENDMDNALEALSLGEVQFVVNCNKIGEGVDVKQCTDVILARHFYTKGEKRQFIGRAIRNDSPCAAWEFQSPIKDTISAKEVVGATKYERLLYMQKGQWHEKLFRGEDPTWGLMGDLRRSPTNPNPNWGIALRKATADHAKRHNEAVESRREETIKQAHKKPDPTPAPKKRLPRMVSFPTSLRSRRTESSSEPSF